MRKHIYLHTSNLNQLRDLRDDIKFEPTPHYPPDQLNLTHQNEYGRIKTHHNYYHIMVGQMKQENCPWCGSGCVLQKTSQGIIKHSQYCMICISCGARGPILNVSQSMEYNPGEMEEITYLIKKRFETRRQWDSGFVNHFEGSYE